MSIVLHMVPRLDPSHGASMLGESGLPESSPVAISCVLGYHKNNVQWLQEDCLGRAIWLASESR